MKTLLFYVIQVILTSGILYGYYHMALRNKRFHRYNRFYLLAATIVSVTIPFFNIPVYFQAAGADSSFVLEALTAISSADSSHAIEPLVTPEILTNWFTWDKFYPFLYFLIASLVLLRVILSLLKIRRIIKNNPVEQFDKIHFINTAEPGTPFSFFRWLFWNNRIALDSEKGEQVFRHELFHIKQGHSRDTVWMELLTVIFWINPFFHLIKKELKAIHEFLADQFAVAGNSKWQYAELLLMQAFSTSQHLVNPFFNNQIKRRIAMITTSKKSNYQYLRKLLVLPVVIVTTGLVAFSYKSKDATEKSFPGNQSVTVVIDAGHGGADAGALGADGTTEKEITLAIARKIEELSAAKNINIILTRDDDTKKELQSIVEITKKYKADLFISLHVNAATKEKGQTGFELVIAGKNKTWEAENKKLAGIMLNFFGQVYTVNKDILQMRSGIYVLDNAPCPSALVECGYLSNTKDLDFIKDPARQEEIAKAVLQSIEWYTRHKKSGFTRYPVTVTDTIKPVTKSVVSEIADEAAIGKNGVNGRLVVIDGKEYAGRSADQAVRVLTAEGIKSVAVLKGPSAIDKYGEAGEQGVIEIITRPVPRRADTTIKPAVDNMIFDRVETEPSFPGGEAAWKTYLQRNANAMLPVDSGAPAGIYKVMVRFIVHKDGFISGITSTTSHGYGMEKEAMRLIKAGPRWIPAKQNGHVVSAYVQRPVTFAVSEETTEPGIAPASDSQ